MGEKIYDWVLALKPDVRINADRLHEHLVGVLGEDFAGISLRGDARLCVHLRDEIADAEKTVEDALTAHDPDALTDAQQREVDRAALIARLRGKAWASWNMTEKDDLLRWLAAWLVAAGE